MTQVRGLANADVIRGVRSMLTVADRGRGGKICQNLAHVICERSLIYYYTVLAKNILKMKLELKK